MPTKKNIGGSILSLDHEKAFDHVEWSFIVNGFISPKFTVSCGVRQGCPLSPLLYVLVIEALAITNQRDPQIEGFILPDRSVQKLVQNADDITVLVCSNTATLKLFNTLGRYEHASRAKQNLSKCHALLLGSWQHRQSFTVDWDWRTDHITVLEGRISNTNKEDWCTPLAKYDTCYVLGVTVNSLIEDKLSLRTF